MKKHWMASLCLAASASVAHADSSSPFELEASLAYAKTNDRYLMVYSSNEKAGGPNIYGRLLHSDGSAAGKDFRLSVQDGKMDKPVVAYDSRTESFLVAWGRKNLGGRAEIVGLHVGLDGRILGQEFRISVSDLYDQRPAIAYCPGRDRYLVTWTRGTKYDFEHGVSDIFGQFIGGDGESMQGSNFVIAAADRNQFKPAVACDVVNDRFLVVWEDQRNLATQDDIYGQLVSSDGALLGDNFVVSATPNVERRPVVAANPDTGNFLLAWESTVGSRLDVFSQAVDAAGGLLGEPLELGAELGGGKNRPAIDYLPRQDVFLVVWDNSTFGNSSDGIYGQLTAGDGRLRQNAFPLTTAKQGQYRPHVVAARNTFLAVWTDYRDTADEDGTHDVYEYYGRVIGNDMALSSRWRNPESE
jgi:hypothetical protein